MTRRQILQRIAVLLGGAISHPVIAAVLDDSHSLPKGDDWRPAALSPEQDLLVTALADLILPATDTPGAAAAQVNRFIDLLLSEWLEDDERERFLTGLADLEESSSSRFGRPFLELTTEEQISLLEPLDVAAVEARIAASSTRRESDVEGLPFFGMLKEMTLVGFYTSKIGVTEELLYDPYHGSFAGCVPLAEVGGTWASES